MKGIARWTIFGLAATLAAAGCAATTGSPPAGVPSPMPGTAPSPTSSAASPQPPSTSPKSSVPSPIPGTPAGTTASGGSITTRTPVPAVVDSQPSAEALTVLRTIPDPLRAGERVQPPKGYESFGGQGAAKPTGAMADTAAADTAVAGPAAETDSDAPVPSPTEPLGDRPALAVGSGLPDSLLTPRSAAASPSAADSSATSGRPARGSAARDTCWRVQIGAPPDTARARALRAAAESQLLVPMVIERERGLYKVRTRDCFSASGSERFRRRALAAGFAGVFRFVEKRR